jgi:ATP-binding cassette subfamily B protein
MSRKKLDFRADAFRQVLGFTFRHWANQPKRIALIAGLVMVATIAEVLVPMFSGRIVDAISGGQDTALNDALRAFAMVAGLGVTSVVLRFFVFNGIIKLTLKMMAQIVNDGFYRVQRFSTDWHANSFAGSTVRKVTRGMWALDALNDILLVALLPSVVMLVGA